MTEPAAQPHSQPTAVPSDSSHNSQGSEQTSQTALPTADLLAAAQPGSIVELPIEGAWVYVPKIFHDNRGSFHEWFTGEEFTDTLGYPFTVAQANLSRSARNVIRGIHLADVPPGQAKIVTCMAGDITDVLVDLRQGSPTYGKHLTIPLNDTHPLIVHVPLGVGHGFATHSDTAVVAYLVTEAYNPTAEWGLHPFDKTLNIDWNIDPDTAILSEKDANAPTLGESTQRLPNYREVRAWEKELREEWALACDNAEGWEGE